MAKLYDLEYLLSLHNQLDSLSQNPPNNTELSKIRKSCYHYYWDYEHKESDISFYEKISVKLMIIAEWADNLKLKTCKKCGKEYRGKVFYNNYCSLACYEAAIVDKPTDKELPKVSQLIDQLIAIKEQHGDIPIVFDSLQDEGHSYQLDLSQTHIEVIENQECGNLHLARRNEMTRYFIPGYSIKFYIGE